MATVKPIPVTDPNASHVIIELFGGDNSLSSYVEQDLAEMSRGMSQAMSNGAGGRFAILALVDTSNTGGQIIEVTSMGRRTVVENLGEIDTGDPETLAQFIARALVTYPNARRALGFWDHGSGVFDEHDATEVHLDRGIRAAHRGARRRPAKHLFVGHLAAKEDPTLRSKLRAMLEDDSSGGILTNYEAHGVVKAAFARAGTKRRFDLIFSDTCLNGMIEVLDQFKSFATVVVGSEELEPGDGWDYQRFLGLMSQKPPSTAAAWGSIAVTAFHDGYRNRPGEYPCTLAAFRTRNKLTSSFAKLVAAVRPLGRDGFRLLDEVRSETQSFAGYNSYDLRDFAVRLVNADELSVKPAAQAIVDAFDRACIGSTALGDDVADARGLAFWFPSNRLAHQREAGTYQKLAFPKSTGWAAYLRERYA
jgi:cysteine peptidase C11 family protein